jgi:ankyrin repeat protein
MNNIDMFNLFSNNNTNMTMRDKFEVAVNYIIARNLTSLKSFLSRNYCLQDPKFTDYYQNNLLHIAVVVEDLEIVNYLVSIDVSFTQQNKFKQSPKSLAVKFSNAAIIEIFANKEKIALKTTVVTLEKEVKTLKRNVDTLYGENTVLDNNNKRLKTDNIFLTDKRTELEHQNKKLKTTLDNMTDAFKK